MNTRIKDLTGKKFGALTVLSFSHSDGRSHWSCLCECGNKSIVASNNLRTTKVNQCGKCRSKPLIEALSLIVMRDYRFRAWSKGLAFKLSKKRFLELLSSPCHYCGTVGSNTKIRGNRELRYNGIDRLNSRNGYISGNVVSCCKNCNMMKKDLSVLEFIQQVQKIFVHTKAN